MIKIKFKRKEQRKEGRSIRDNMKERRDKEARKNEGQAKEIVQK